MQQMRTEYPRPRLERSEWLNLNGQWEYVFDFTRSGDYKDWKNSARFDGKINVPFCPESKLSGVGYTDFIEMMWYRRTLQIPAAWQNRMILLHFNAVDYSCIVYLDGSEVGRHTGGSSPFAIDLTGKVQPGSAHNLVVRVEDYGRSGLQTLGKQSTSLESRKCQYTRTTGIWQTVWMEAVDPFALKDCRIMPDFDNGSFTFLPEFYRTTAGLKFSVSLLDNGTEVACRTVNASNSSVVTLELQEPKAWNPETPFLYDVVYTLYAADGTVLDEVKSYAGLRKVHCQQGRFYLNNQPVFLRLVLDQGFYADGLWTAPSDEDLQRDIKLAMQAGFNGARLHQKVFDERFHYWADRLGYLTWAEFPSWGMSFWQHFQKTNTDYHRSFLDYLAEWSAVVERDRNHPSIIAWSPFNETNADCCYDIDEHRKFMAEVYDLTRRLDPTRPVNDTSGYCHVKTDLWTIHSYVQNGKELEETLAQEPVYMRYPEFEAPAWNGQPLLAAEYGGVSFLPEGREPYSARSWGYNKNKLTFQEAQQRIIELTETLVNHPQMAGYCYTQLTDIEQEQNGIYNYDRTAKFDMSVIRECFSAKPPWSRY